MPSKDFLSTRSSELHIISITKITKELFSMIYQQHEYKLDKYFEVHVDD